MNILWTIFCLFNFSFSCFSPSSGVKPTCVCAAGYHGNGTFCQGLVLKETIYIYMNGQENIFSVVHLYSFRGTWCVISSIHLCGWRVDCSEIFCSSANFHPVMSSLSYNHYQLRMVKAAMHLLNCCSCCVTGQCNREKCYPPLWIPTLCAWANRYLQLTSVAVINMGERALPPRQHSWLWHCQDSNSQSLDNTVKAFTSEFLSAQTSLSIFLWPVEL